MGEALLGETFDIHGGGIDLMFPHHENEIAQSESAHHEHPLARVWMHNGFLQVEGEKMSKSLGNFITINELLKDWDGEVLRFNMLRTLYRQPIDWTLAGMKESENTLGRWAKNAEGVTSPVVDKGVLNALLDDLNTPQAMSLLHQTPAEELAGGMSLLGFSGKRPTDRSMRKDIDQAFTVYVEGQIDFRTAARKAKDFKESDRIRDELLAKGIVLKDGPNGTTWEVKR